MVNQALAGHPLEPSETPYMRHLSLMGRRSATTASSHDVLGIGPLESIWELWLARYG
jgi:hypothetical protein